MAALCSFVGIDGVGRASRNGPLKELPATSQPGPKADVRKQPAHTVEETKERSMLADLFLSILGPISAKRYVVVRIGLSLMLAVFLVLLIYGTLSS